MDLSLFRYKRTWKALPFPIELIQYALKLSKSAANCSSLHWNHLKTPFTFGTFSQRGRHELKKAKRVVTPIK